MLPRVGRLRVDCTWLRGVPCCGYGAWHAIQGPWLLGAVLRLIANLRGQLCDRRVSQSRRDVDPFSGGGDDLRVVVVVHVVMYFVAPVE